MRIVIDEDMGSRRLAADVGLRSTSDARVLTWAVGQARAVLTRDHEDFADPHDPVLVVRFDNDPRHNLSDRGIATAMESLEPSGVAIEGRIHVLNHGR